MQVLLPLVLILTFVIIVQILTYKYSYEKVIDVIGPPSNSRLAFNKKIIELQLLELLLAFENIKNEEIKKLRIPMFSDASLVRRNKLTLSDDNFKYLCKETNKIFEKSGKQQLFMNGMYENILEQSGIKGKNSNQVKRWNKISDSEIIRLGNIADAQPDVVFPENRRKIHNRIIDFTEGLENDVVNLQMQLIRLLYDDWKYDMKDQDRELKNLVVKMLDPNTSDRVRREKAESFYKKLNEKLKNLLTGDDYEFLDECWQELNSILRLYS